MDKITLIVSILPAILLWKYVNKLDKHKEPMGILLKLFFGGVISIVITLIISLLISLVFTDFFEYDPEFNLVGFLYSFLGIGLVEEASKFIMMYLFSWKSKYLDETYDIVLYTMIVALGFATAENILYSLESGFMTSVFRFFTAVPGHVIDGAFMGYFLYLYRVKPQDKTNLILAILVPALLHGIYDFIVFTSETIFNLIVFIVFITIEFIIARKMVKKMAKNSTFLPLKKIYCTNCGTAITTRYCPNCGKERQK